MEAIFFWTRNVSKCHKLGIVKDYAEPLVKATHPYSTFSRMFYSMNITPLLRINSDRQTDLSVWVVRQSILNSYTLTILAFTSCCSVVVITLDSNARGPRFESYPGHSLFRHN